jgi:c-di-AMP phosphodiesterase-like protein
VDAYDNLHKKASEKRLLELQGLLTDTNKPWYTMVNTITQKKICMEKFY